MHFIPRVNLPASLLRPHLPFFAGTGRFQFAHPSTQQHLLVWRDRPKVVMVIKKLGSELNHEFFSVVSYLMETERMHVVVEPHMFDQATQAGVASDRLFTYGQGEQDR